MAKICIPAEVDCPSSDNIATRGTVRLDPVTVAAVVLLVTVATVVAERLAAGGHGAGTVFQSVAVSGSLPAAITAIEREREQLQRERDAFERFAAAVESISVRSRGATGVSPVLVDTGGASGSELSEVRTAYRDTVMGVDHFDREYGEGLYENMAMELTENVATAVVNGQQFSKPLKRTVIRQSQMARSRRDSLLETVSDERDSVEHARERIREIESTVRDEPDPSDCSLTELFDAERRFRWHLARYEQLLQRRQRDIHSSERLQSVPDRPFLQAYLYESLGVDFPILATVIERYERLRNRQRAVRRKIARYSSED